MKDLKIYLFVASGLFILYLLLQYNRPKATDWRETLYNSDKIPYGTYVLYNRLPDLFPGATIRPYREPVYNVLNDHNITNGSYIVICNSVNLNENDYKKLDQFIKNGNDVFIAADYFGDQFSKSLKIETRTELRLATIRLFSSSADSNKYYGSDKGLSNSYFSKLDTAKAIALGKNNFGHCNFVKYTIGKGSLYLSANPLMFSNYAILDKQNTTYAATALSYINNNKNLIWDEFYTKGRQGEENVMRVFLSHIELKWAFYIAAFSLITFVFYQMKRRQRVIPIITPLANSTLDFVRVVGQVYFEKRNNANIAHKKILYLLTYLRDGYHLRTTKFDAEFLEKLVGKLGLDRAFATQLVNHLQYLTVQQHVTDHELIELNKLIEQFYIQSR